MQLVANSASINSLGTAEIFPFNSGLTGSSKAQKNQLQLCDPLASIKNTDWYFLYIEATDLLLCSLGDLDAAFSSAPNDAAAGYIRAIFDVRSLQAALAGTNFN